MINRIINIFSVVRNALLPTAPTTSQPDDDEPKGQKMYVWQAKAQDWDIQYAKAA